MSLLNFTVHWSLTWDVNVATHKAAIGADINVFHGLILSVAYLKLTKNSVPFKWLNKLCTSLELVGKYVGLARNIKVLNLSNNYLEE